MSSHESHPNSDQPERPDHEHLPDYEIDLTGSVEQPEALIDVIHDAIVEAGQDKEVPDWGARVMARYLANILGDPGSALHHFAVTERADHQRLREELARLWQDHADTDFTSGVINCLGTYLIATQRPDDRPPGSETVQGLIAKHGAPFEAFLQLPDVTEQTAESDYLESYYGSFASVEALVQHVAESHDVWQLLEDASLTHLASPDPELLLKLARQRWDIVSRDGRIHLFDK